MQQRLQTLYELHYDALLSFATISLQHSQMAEDIVQETFLLYMEQEDKQIATRKKRSLLSIFLVYWSVKKVTMPHTQFHMMTIFFL